MLVWTTWALHTYSKKTLKIRAWNSQIVGENHFHNGLLTLCPLCLMLCLVTEGQRAQGTLKRQNIGCGESIGRIGILFLQLFPSFYAGSRRSLFFIFVLFCFLTLATTSFNRPIFIQILQLWSLAVYTKISQVDNVFAHHLMALKIFNFNMFINRTLRLIPRRLKFYTFTGHLNC